MPATSRASAGSAIRIVLISRPPRYTRPATGGRSLDGPQPPAVHVVARAQAVTRPRRAEERVEVGQLLGGGEPADGRVLFRDVVQILLGRLPCPSREDARGLAPVGRQDQPGVDRVDPDAVLDELIGQTLGE